MGRHLRTDALPGLDHPTISAIVPIVCFVSTFTVLVLFRLVSIFGGMTAHCVGTDQFWYLSASRDWPLVAAFFLVFFLLLVWSVVIAIGYWRHSAGTRIMIVVNIFAVSICLYTFKPLHESAYFEYHKRNGYYEGIKFNPFLIQPIFTEDQCTTYRRFAGRWRVVEREIGYYELDLPYSWIDLHSWGDVRAPNIAGQREHEGTWIAPYQDRYSEDRRWRYGYIWIGDNSAPWNFDLRGNRLILTSPDDFNERERSTLILERIEQPPFRRNW